MRRMLALSWSMGLSIAAIVIAGISVVIAGLSAKFTYDAGQRDEERLKRERDEADAASRARIQLWATGSQATPDQRRCAYRIANVGKVTASGVRVWLRDANGNDVSITPQPTFDLAPDQADTTRGIPVPPDLDLNDLRFTVAWNDGEGPHTWVTPLPPIERRHGRWPEDATPS
jgi:hypothetical protein